VKVDLCVHQLISSQNQRSFLHPSESSLDRYGLGSIKKNYRCCSFFTATKHFIGLFLSIFQQLQSWLYGLLKIILVGNEKGGCIFFFFWQPICWAHS
jgi:hypothetical protein